MGPGSDRKNRSVRFLNNTITRPAASGRAKLGPVPVNLLALHSLATPVASNLQFRVSGISIYGRIEISYCKSQNVDFGMSLSFLIYWPPL